MGSHKRWVSVAVISLILLNLLSGLAAAGSHYPLSVVLWNDDADFKPVNANFTVWGQVYQGNAPFDASSVQFRFGLDFPPVAPFVNYTATYAGSPGLYRANVTITVWDVSFGVSRLAIVVRNGNDTATTQRVVITNSTIVLSGGTTPPVSTVRAGLDNLAELGPTLNPGETLRWRIETRANGLNADASSLSTQLYVDPEVDFTETPTSLPYQRTGTGVYEANYTIPPGWTESRQIVLRATINEANFAQDNASSDLWFYDTAARLDAINQTSVKGELTVGDGMAVKSGLQVNVSVAEALVPTHLIGWINGTTSATGKLAFDLVNDGTLELAARGWVNGTFSEFLSEDLHVAGPYVPPAVDTSRFDAVSLSDISKLPWSGTHNLPFEFWNNGTLWNNSSVLAFVSNSRGILTATTLVTDAAGQATLAVNFSLKGWSIDDAINGGMNFTFRAAVGLDNRSSDGLWWGEDEETLSPDSNPALFSKLFDTNLTFATTSFALGSPLGVGGKYSGAANVTGFRGLSILFPGNIWDFFGDRTATYGIWTGHDAPFISYLMDGNGNEYFGTLWAPSYWPSTTYTVLAALAPHVGNLGGEGSPIGPINWTEISPGATLGGFSPSADTTPPELYGPANMTFQGASLVSLNATAYDNTIDFFSTGNYTWGIEFWSSNTVLYGNGASTLLSWPGTYNVSLTVRDSTGNTVGRNFTVTIVDILGPIADAGPDFTAKAGELVWFNGTSSDDDPVYPAGARFSWQFVYNNTSEVQNLTEGSFVFWVLGDYTLTFTATDATNNSGTDSFVLTIVSPDQIAPTASAGPDVVVIAGTSQDFNGTATDNDPSFPTGARLGWSFVYNGTPMDIPGENLTFTFWAPGVYGLTFYAFDGWNNMGADTLTVTVVPPDTAPPVPAAGADITITAGVPQAFNGTATDDDPNFANVSRYQWSFTYNGTAQSFAGENFSFVFWAPGTYTLTFTAWDGWNNSAQDTLILTVERPDQIAPVVSAGPDITVNVGTNVSLSGSATDNDPTWPTGARYWWTFNIAPNVYNLSGKDTSFVFSRPGLFDVTLWVEDGWGNIGSDTRRIEVIPPDTTPPQVQPIADTSLAPGATYSFVASATDNSVNFTTTGNYSWAFVYNGSGVTLYGNGGSFTFYAVGDYVVNLTVRDWAGNAARRSFTLHIVVPDTTPPDVQASVGASTVVAGTVVNFSGAATDAGSPLTSDSAFTWSFTYNGSVVTLTGRSAQFTFDIAGNYTVTLTVRDAAGNGANSTVAVTVTEKPQPPGATTPTGPGIEIYLVAALLAAVAVVAYVLLRRKPADQAPAKPPADAPAADEAPDKGNE